MAKQWMFAAITVAGLGYSGSARADAVASFAPSRTSGVAPLAVFFDAKASTCADCAGVVDAWHDLVYAWDFDDADAGTWALNKRSKGRDIGPVAAHVFETPGTYTVSLTVTDAVSGKTATTTMEIDVADPDTTFADDKTRCYRATDAGDFAGCPAGAQQKTMASFNAVYDDCKGDTRRCLLRRGDMFKASGTVNLGGDAPQHIGAFGAGAKPLIDATGIGSATLLSGQTGGDDYRIVDLAMKGASIKGGKIFGAKQPQRDVLILRVESAGHTWHNFLEMEQTQLNTKGWHERMFLVDNVMKKGGFGAGGNIAFFTFKNSALLGNEFTDTTNGEHIIRAGAFDTLLIAHNLLGPADNIRSVITLRSSDADIPCEGGVCAPSRRGVIQANTLRITNGWTVQVCGQAGMQNNQCEDTLVDGNFAYLDPAFPLTTDPIVVFNLADQTTKRTSFRNNICNLTDAVNHCADLKVATLARAIGNTCFRSDAGPISCIYTTGMTPNGVSTRAQNNLAFTSGGGMITVVAGGWGTIENNSKPAMSPFAAPAPFDDPMDFMLLADAPAHDGGVLAANGFDFAGRPRPAGAAHDIGAWEFGAVDEPLTVDLGDVASPIAVDSGFSLSAVAAGGTGSPTFAWDCDGDGTFETPTDAVAMVQCPGLAAGVYTVAVQASDASGMAVDSAMLEVAAGCGDGQIGPGEVCDGDDLGGESCASQGFAGGALACDGCGAFDTSGCTQAETDTIGESTGGPDTPTTGGGPTAPGDTGDGDGDGGSASSTATTAPDATATAPTPTTTADGGGSDGSSGGPDADGDDGGCGCDTPADPTTAALLPLALVLLRRRRR